MLVLLLGFDLQVSLPLHKYCLSKPSAPEIETTPSKCVTQWKELNASSSVALKRLHLLPFILQQKIEIIRLQLLNSKI